MGSLSLDCYHFYFLMILKETLTFQSISNLVLQYISLWFYSTSLSGSTVQSLAKVTTLCQQLSPLAPVYHVLAMMIAA